MVALSVCTRLNHQVGKVGLRHAAVGARAALKNVNSRLSGQVEAAEAMQRLERDARDSRGEMRKSKLRAWCQVRHRLTKTPRCTRHHLCCARTESSSCRPSLALHGAVNGLPMPCHCNDI
jgi:hypothetical protein